MVSRACWKCQYVNKLESKYCEKPDCGYPLTQIALDEIKAAEQVKIQELVDKSNIERNNTIQLLQHQLRSYDDKIEQFGEKLKIYLDRQKERRREAARNV